jgi:hypothetical protein
MCIPIQNKTSMSTEDLLIKKIEGAIRGIRMGNKAPKDVASEVAHGFARLKTLNEGMHDDLMEKYKNVVKDYNQKHK